MELKWTKLFLISLISITMTLLFLVSNVEEQYDPNIHVTFIQPLKGKTTSDYDIIKYNFKKCLFQFQHQFCWQISVKSSKEKKTRKRFYFGTHFGIGNIFRWVLETEDFRIAHVTKIVSPQPEDQNYVILISS